jgi:4-diphosphocytidyl-2-C-methyl-D-erythritol kinase
MCRSGGHVDGLLNGKTRQRRDGQFGLGKSGALDTAAASFNSAPMRVLAPAKINLHLRVGPRRADGFHSLLSWFATVGLFDNLVLEQHSPAAGLSQGGTGAGSAARAPAGSRDDDAASVMTLACDTPGLPCDERNLVVKIALAFAREARASGRAVDAPRIEGAHGDAPDPSRGVRGDAPATRAIRATLKKSIPMGAGLGGGSSDAARTLLALNQLWGVGRAADDLSAFAARFGSDLPFFFHGPSSICRGRGEIVRPIGKPAPRWAVLVLPEVTMPTPDVYRRFDAMGIGREQDLTDEPDWESWTRLSSLELLPRLVNDLEPPAFAIAPQLAKLRERIERIVGRPVRMSGSGSSLFTLFDDGTEARDASARIVQDTGERAPAVELSPSLRDDLNTAFAIG